MIRTRTLLVPFALCATGISLAFLSGCRKEGESVAAPSAQLRQGLSTPAERMADKEYVAKLDAQRDEMKRLAAQMNAATNDAQRKAVAALLEVNRLKTAELVRARMTVTNKEISK